MENLLFKLTEYQYEILMAILERPGQNPGDFFFDFPSIDGYVEMFLKAKLVSINESDELSITELGRAHLAEFELQQKNRKRTRSTASTANRCHYIYCRNCQTKCNIC